MGHAGSTALKISAFLALNIGIYAFVAAKADRGYHPRHPGESKQTLYFIPKNSRTDLLFLGSSRSKAFSHYHNHTQVERILGRKIVNLSIDGAGVIPAYILFKYFLSRDNSADEAILFLDHADIVAAEGNENSPFLALEPLRWGLLPYAISGGLSFKRIAQYLYMKLHKKFKDRPILGTRDERRLAEDFDREEARRAYDERDFGATGWGFSARLKRLDAIARLCKENGIRFRLVLLPGAFYDRAKARHYSENLWKAFLSAFAKERGILLNDFRLAVPEAKYYADPMHLNSEGIEHFTQKYLLPALNP
jgi:hypothetical protein